MLSSFRLILFLFIVTLAITSPTVAQEATAIELRIRGMLIGSLIGDAAGGPVEFKSADELKEWLPDLRSWTADRFRKSIESGELANAFHLLPYEKIRPAIAPYGPWEKDAPAGTVTDDSRHKIILMNCLRGYSQNPKAITEQDLARAYVAYANTQSLRGRMDYAKLADESLKEYVTIARWILGERDLQMALPPQRLWAGIGTCSGQMTMLPLAGLYPGKPDLAYRATYALGFVDVGSAKDINSALVAALSAAIGAVERDSSSRWNIAIEAIRQTDPYRYGDVPFAKRPATEWLDFALSTADRAKDSPAELFRILETEGRAKYFWDAHFTFASAIAFLKFCDFQPLEALTVSLVFGHDTDSAAQVIGALAGAVHGEKVFPEESCALVELRLKVDYAEDINEWVATLKKLRDANQPPGIIPFLEQLE